MGILALYCAAHSIATLLRVLRHSVLLDAKGAAQTVFFAGANFPTCKIYSGKIRIAPITEGDFCA